MDAMYFEPDQVFLFPHESHFCTDRHFRKLLEIWLVRYMHVRACNKNKCIR